MHLPKVTFYEKEQTKDKKFSSLKSNLTHFQCTKTWCAYNETINNCLLFFRNDQVFQQGVSQFPLSSSSTRHTWQQAHDLQL